MQCPALASPCLARQLRAGSMQPSPRKAAASAALGTPRFRGRDASPTLSSPPTPRQGQFAQRRLSASVPPSRRSVSRTSPPRAAAGAPPPPASGNGPSASSGGWSSVLTLPTILTLLRVAAVPALLAGACLCWRAAQPPFLTRPPSPLPAHARRRHRHLPHLRDCQPHRLAGWISCSQNEHH